MARNAIGGVSAQSCLSVSVDIHHFVEKIPMRRMLKSDIGDKHSVFQMTFIFLLKRRISCGGISPSICGSLIIG
jgi:hypothetical protein